MKQLGLIICGNNKDFRWIEPILYFQTTDDGRAYTCNTKNQWYFDALGDIVEYDPEDAIATLGGFYKKIPEQMISFIGAELKGAYNDGIK